MTQKTRDPSWRWLRALSKKVIPSKKGKGSYKRKPKQVMYLNGEKNEESNKED
jgi:hypothetical protein|tara:strand:+ start:398 stop:556 length:159 start_codon:yes stop_codon:yes gene_type:complete